MLHDLFVVWKPSGFADYVRYITILLLAFLCGGNMAFTIQTIHLFPKRAIIFWRMFFSGKTAINLYLISELISKHGKDLTWRTPLVLLGTTFSLIALFLLRRNAPYKYYVIRPDLLSEEDRAKIINELEEPHEQGS